MKEKQPKVDKLIKEIKRMAAGARNAYAVGKLDRTLEKTKQGLKLIENLAN